MPPLLGTNAPPTLQAALENAISPGFAYVNSHDPAPNPLISVTEAGIIGLPLSVREVEVLRECRGVKRRARAQDKEAKKRRRKERDGESVNTEKLGTENEEGTAMDATREEDIEDEEDEENAWDIAREEIHADNCRWEVLIQITVAQEVGKGLGVKNEDRIRCDFQGATILGKVEDFKFAPESPVQEIPKTEARGEDCKQDGDEAKEPESPHEEQLLREAAAHAAPAPSTLPPIASGNTQALAPPVWTSPTGLPPMNGVQPSAHGPPSTITPNPNPVASMIAQRAVRDASVQQLVSAVSGGHVTPAQYTAFQQLYNGMSQYIPSVPMVPGPPPTYTRPGQLLPSSLMLQQYNESSQHFPSVSMALPPPPAYSRPERPLPIPTPLHQYAPPLQAVPNVEKTFGMLLVLLPSTADYTISFSHNGFHEVHSSSDEQSPAARTVLVAAYAGAHQAITVISGHCFVLRYNLVYSGPAPGPSLPDPCRDFRDAVQAWIGGGRYGPHGEQAVAWVFDFIYTDITSATELKGPDAFRMQLLQQVGKELGLQLYTVQLEYREVTTGGSPTPWFPALGWAWRDLIDFHTWTDLGAGRRVKDLTVQQGARNHGELVAVYPEKFWVKRTAEERQSEGRPINVVKATGVVFWPSQHHADRVQSIFAAHPGAGICFLDADLFPATAEGHKSREQLAYSLIRILDSKLRMAVEPNNEAEEKRAVGYLIDLTFEWRSIDMFMSIISSVGRATLDSWFPERLTQAARVFGDDAMRTAWIETVRGIVRSKPADLIAKLETVADAFRQDVEAASVLIDEMLGDRDPSEDLSIFSLYELPRICGNLIFHNILLPKLRNYGNTRYWLSLPLSCSAEVAARLPALVSAHDPTKPASLRYQRTHSTGSPTSTTRRFSDSWGLFNACISHSRLDLASTVLSKFISLPLPPVNEHRLIFLDLLEVLQIHLQQATPSEIPDPSTAFTPFIKAAVIDHILPCLGPRPPKQQSWALRPLDHHCPDCRLVSTFMTDPARRETTWRMNLAAREQEHLRVALAPAQHDGELRIEFEYLPTVTRVSNRPRYAVHGRQAVRLMIEKVRQVEQTHPEAERWEQARRETEEVVKRLEKEGRLGSAGMIVLFAVSSKGNGWTERIGKAVKELGAKVKVAQVMQSEEMRAFLRTYAPREVLQAKPKPLKPDAREESPQPNGIADAGPDDDDNRKRNPMAPRLPIPSLESVRTTTKHINEAAAKYLRDRKATSTPMPPATPISRGPSRRYTTPIQSRRAQLDASANYTNTPAAASASAARKRKASTYVDASGSPPGGSANKENRFGTVSGARSAKRRQHMVPLRDIPCIDLTEE